MGVKEEEEIGLLIQKLIDPEDSYSADDSEEDNRG